MLFRSEKKEAIKFIDAALKKMRRKRTTPEELIGSWQDINQAVNWNAISGGKKKLAELKKPILAALKKSSPQIAEDFEITNNLYSKFKENFRKLRPDLLDHWLEKGKVGAAAVGIVTGNRSLLQKVGTAAGVSILSRELLINPRYQDLSRKILKGIQQGKVSQVNALLKTMKNDLKKQHPDEDWDFGGKETIK